MAAPFTWPVAITLYFQEVSNLQKLSKLSITIVALLSYYIFDFL